VLLRLTSLLADERAVPSAGVLSTAPVSQTSTADMLDWYCAKQAIRGAAASQPHASGSYAPHQVSTTCMQGAQPWFS